jgi:chromosome segregation ATPase
VSVTDQPNESDHLRGRVRDLDAANATLRDRIEELEEQVDQDLQLELANLQADNDRLEAENSELDDRIEEVEGQVDQDLQTELDSLQANNDRLEAENAQLDDRVEELEARVDQDLQMELDSLQADNDRSETENAQLKARLNVPVDPERESSDEEPHYLASKNRNKFHRPHCKWVQYISTYQMLEFGSHREAVEAGYKPCGTCRA